MEKGWLRGLVSASGELRLRRAQTGPNEAGELAEAPIKVAQTEWDEWDECDRIKPNQGQSSQLGYPNDSTYHY
jgi:hypothetical protein